MTKYPAGTTRRRGRNRGRASPTFPGLFSRALAEMCGVDHKTVEAVRVPPGEIPHLGRTGQDGKQYPASRPARNDEEKNQKEAAGGGLLHKPRPDEPVYVLAAKEDAAAELHKGNLPAFNHAV